jgi:hypothetical protein
MPVLSEIDNIERRGIQPLQRVYFKVATTCFRIKRAAENRFETLESLPRGNRADFPFLLAESRSPVFSDRLQELPFETGKLENLRIAARGMDGTVVPAGAQFSFWKQVGKPTAGRGFRVGREIRWGCMVPSVGGGLCQLSGALYECTLKIGARITEVHPHSRRLPQLPYRPETDATIYWNYVDFRFRPSADILIEFEINAGELILRFRGKSPQEPVSAKPWALEKSVAHDCLDCGIGDCLYHEKTQRFTNLKGFVFSPAPGFESPFQKLKMGLLSLSGRFLNRVLAGFGLPVGKVAVLRGRYLAIWVKTLFPSQRSTALVSQDLAPFLKSWLQSRAIPYVLKLEHLPMKVLQNRLDRFVELHPGDRRLKEYRVGEEICRNEEDCIGEAKALVTDHPYLKELFPSAELRAGSQVPRITENSTGPKDKILFPGPCYAREGIEEVLQAAGRLNLEVLCPHPTAQGNPSIRYTEKSLLPWGRIGAYVHPCVFDRPNPLLDQAVANEVPILGTLGVPYRGPLFGECALGKFGDLEEKLQKIQNQQKGGKNA